MNAPEPTAQDAIAQVGHALRIAASQDANRRFWLDLERNRSRNHETLRWAAFGVLNAHDHGVSPSAESLERLRAALEELERIEASVTAHLAGVREC